MKSGIVLIDKAKGFTSRQEINYLGKVFNTKKVGHIGTLDPFADGLLIALIEKGTKLSQFLEGMDKEYIATLKLGKKTDSGDINGNIIEEKSVPNLTNKTIKEVLTSFVGQNEQLPPMYSAIKVNGKELYKYARSGEEIERKKRTITIHSLNLISFKDDEIVFLAHVSKGTYIRTLGEDIAERLGTVGYLTSLTRTRIGNFRLDNAHKKEDVTENDIIDMKSALSFMKEYKLNDEEYKMVNNGMHLRLKSSEKTLLLTYNDEVIAVYELMNNGYYKSIRGLR